MSAIHSVLEAPVKKQNIILTAISMALFNIPSEHTERLERLWVDDLVYTSAWRKHVSERVEDLKLKMIWVRNASISLWSIILFFFHCNSISL
jgi:hypothetical protein